MNLQSVLTLIGSGDPTALEQLADGAAPDPDDVRAEDKQALSRAAARAGQAGILRWLFEHHLYSVDPDAHGRTLLHEAASSGDADTVCFALDVLGFDPLAGDDRGVTSLDLAAAAVSKNPSALRLLSGRAGFTPDAGYRNPVLRGFHPDPSVVRAGEDFYLVTSSFFLFPGLPVFHSRDLVHWEEIGHAVHDLDASGLAGLPGGFGYWAPDISFFKGRFWIAATLRQNTKPYRLQMVTSAADPRGPWDPPKFLPLDGIDPSLFTDGDGRRYILLNPGAMIAEISETGELLSGPRMISFGHARIKPEGPHLLKKDGWYYLFLAEGGTGDGHMETVFRSRNLYGPYESCPFNPILGKKNPLSPVQRSGHGKPVQLPDGSWAMIYLCGRYVEGMTLLGRETALDPMEWTADGWPMINGLKGPSCLQKPPLPFDSPAGETPEKWVAPRTDPASFAEISGDTIALRAGADPSGTGPCSLLLARQKESAFTQRVTVDLSGTAEGAWGGLAGYYDERSFCLFGLRKEASGCSLILSEQAGEERTTRVLASLDSPVAVLSVRGEGLARRFSLLQDSAEAAGITVRTPYLCDEGLPLPKRFTGALLGLGAVGYGTAVFRGHRLEHYPGLQGGTNHALP